MTFRAAIAISVILHVVLLGVAYTVEVPEELEPESMAFRDFASVDFQTVRADEVDEDGSDDPMLGAPEPIAQAEPEPIAQAKPEPVAEPTPEPEPEPEPKAQPKPEPGIASDEELKSVVADRREASDSPVETAEVADADAKAVASTAPENAGDADDAGKISGKARADQVEKQGVGTSGAHSGPRGIRNGSGADQKKLNQKYGLILHRQITGAKTYPRFARKAGIEGRLLVEITIDRSGAILAVKVRESSGHEILDETTIDTIRRFERFPVPPRGLTWQQKTFVLPVSYKLS